MTDHSDSFAPLSATASACFRPGEPTGDELEDEVSDLGVDALRSEAAEAGDLEMVRLCDRALEGDGLARARCAAAFLDAVAKLEESGEG